jgi:LacI family transcriptional regulator
MSHFHELHDKGLPIVFFDRVCESIDTHKVIADNFKGAYDATAHLVKSGYKKIAHITSSPNVSITRERLAGYQKALQDHMIAFDESLVMYCDHGGLSQQEIEAAVSKVLRHKAKPMAILAASDRISLGVMTCLTEKKIAIPGRMALVGFTNSQQVKILAPSLTAVTQPAFEIGQVATEKLIQLIESKTPIEKFETCVLKTQLIVGLSSARA